MNENSPFLILDEPCEDAINRIIHQANRAGMQVMRTFDLQDVIHEHGKCPCPYHGTDDCDCQMVILLVYGRKQEPVSLIAHGHKGRTWFSMVDTPEQRADPQVKAAIFITLSPDAMAQNSNQAGLSVDDH